MTGTTPEDPAHSLRLALIEAQYALRATAHAPRGRGVVVLVSGVELAGKGEAVTQLREWMDPRLLQVSAHLPRHQDWRKPLWLPYVRDLPERGQLVVLFGNWYGDLLAARMAGKTLGLSRAEFERQVLMLREFEQDLRAEGVTVVKCWFDLPWAQLQTRLDRVDPALQQWQQLHGLDWRNQAQYDELQHLRQALGEDWINIDCCDPEQRDLAFGHVVLDALKLPRAARGAAKRNWPQAQIPASLAAPDQNTIEKEVYKAERKKLQKQFSRLARLRGDRPLLLVFEGMDAAGKGGAIRRVVAPLDPREYSIYSIAAPEAYERRHGYLWRFWRRLPVRGGMAIFDRSWYGRVLVERIEGLARAPEWQQAYAEINRFEAQLADAGAIILKFWLAIDADEQLRRFQAREQTAHKRFKLTSEDWRNRERWGDYVQAAADMLEMTNTPEAPWFVVATNDKYTARLAILKAINQQLEQVLKSG